MVEKKQHLLKMVNARNKGAAFERYIVNMLNTYFENKGIDKRVKRNLNQYQEKGQADIYLDNIAIECKRYKSGSGMPRNNWWTQTLQSAGDKYIPILIWKYDRKPPQAIIPAWLMSEVPRSNKVTLMCPLADICKNLDEVLQKANGR